MTTVIAEPTAAPADLIRRAAYNTEDPSAPAPVFVLRAAFPDAPDPAASTYRALCWLTEQERAGNPYAKTLRAYHDGLIQQIVAATSDATLTSLKHQVNTLRGQRDQLARQLAEMRAGIVTLPY